MKNNIKSSILFFVVFFILMLLLNYFVVNPELGLNKNLISAFVSSLIATVVILLLKRKNS